MGERRRCAICGALMPRSATRRGWAIARIFRRGLGTRYYRHCGYCCTSRAFYETAMDWLFEEGRDFTARAEHVVRLLLFP